MQEIYQETIQLTAVWAWVWRAVIFAGIFSALWFGFAFERKLPRPTDWEREDEMEVHNFKKHQRALNRINQAEKEPDFFRIPSETEAGYDEVIRYGQQIEF